MNYKAILINNEESHIMKGDGKLLCDKSLSADMSTKTMDYLFPSQVSCFICLDMAHEGFVHQNRMITVRYETMENASIFEATMWEVPETIWCHISTAVDHSIGGQKELKPYKVEAIFKHPPNSKDWPQTVKDGLTVISYGGSGKPVNIMTEREFQVTLGTTADSASWWLSDKGGSLRHSRLQNAQEFRTNRCVDCDKIIKTHSNIKWRLKPNQIRCVDCAETLISYHNETRTDAYYTP